MNLPLLRQLRIISLVCLFFLSTTVSVESQNPPSSLSYEPEQNFTIAFVNFDQDLVDFNAIQLGLPSQSENYLPYDINYELVHVNDSYETALNQFIDNVASEPDWTSSLDAAALNEQKTNFERKSIFSMQNGTAIDALMVEEYLDSHPIESTLPDENHYTIFMFNLSRLDSGDNDHWFNITEVDPDAGRARFFWRLEWDYDLGNNFNVKFPYAAFSQNTDTTFIDLTAFQWYLEWRAIWNDLVNPHSSYYDDLDTLIKGLTPSAMTSVITETAINWLSDWINLIYNMPIQAEALGSSMSIQLNVMYRSSEINLSNIEWIVNSEYTHNTVNNLFQSMDFEVVTTFIDMDQDTFMDNLFEQNNLPYSSLYPSGSGAPFEDWKYYNGNGLYYALTDSQVSNLYYNESAADLVLKGSIYLVDNASYAGGTPWVGGLFTGLGGDLKLTILYELDRALMSDHVTRKSGLSRVLVHEIGHAIGIPHTFSNRFTSDFLSDTMGYYPSSGNYSEILSLQYQKTAVDSLFSQVTTLYQTNVGNVPDQWLLSAASHYENAIELHKAKHFLEASFELTAALAAMEGDLGITSSSSSSNGDRKTSFLFPTNLLIVTLVGIMISKKLNLKLKK